MNAKTKKTMPPGVVEAREKHLAAIVRAESREMWAEHPETKALRRDLEEDMEAVRRDANYLLAADDELPDKAAMKAERAKYAAYGDVKARILGAASALKIAVDSALEFERQEQQKDGLHYVAPEWPNTAEGWIKAARDAEAARQSA